MFENSNIYSWINDKEIKAKRVSIDDLSFALDWLGCYETDDKETAQSLVNAMAFLLKEINKRDKKAGK